VVKIKTLIRTLKGKITFIYTFLVVIIIIIGIISAYNIFKLGKAIDGLITDNYKSIAAVNNMNGFLDAEERSILGYIQFEKDDAIALFYKSNDGFYSYLNTERNNITEISEKDLVNATNIDYLNFVKLFSQLQDYKNTHNDSETIQYYNTTIIPAVEKVRNDLKDITQLNEKAMFNRKNEAKLNSNQSMYLVIVISTLCALLGLLVSIFYASKILKPVYMLAETIKSVNEGDINKEAPVIYDDEIGMLSREFNNMTKRLQEFEKSNKGKLLEEKNKSITIVRSISEPLFILDTNYKIILVNTSCENFFNITEDAVRNKYIFEVIKNTELYEHIFNVINNNKNDSGKIISVVNNEIPHYFNTMVTILRNKDLQVNGIIVLLKNITELKQFEKMRSDFIDTISHEFKTPLTSIMMGVGLIMDKNVGTLNEKQTNLLTSINEDVERLNNLVSNLLKLSKVQSDKAIFDLKPCHIEDIVKKSIDNFKEQTKAKEVNIRCNIETNLPNVLIDGEKITWVINNLISNSIKHTKPSDIITVGACQKTDCIHVYVSDNGEGIPAEFLEKVFDRFVQVKGYEPESLNTGLGLSIAKEIVEAHGGTIWCESKLNVGSTFTFTIPVVDTLVEGE
jgi:signal transduction histidine kinase